ncbi:MAG: ABC transporter ATP-binding protein [Sphaerochaetaceae bacterium]
MQNDYCLKTHNLSKVYHGLMKEDTIALQDINLEIKKGEFVSIIGPSGCGKSTFLRIIGGLDKPTKGSIEYEGGPKQDLGFVFQDSVLLPWKTVKQNAGFPLEIKKIKTKESEERLDDLLNLVGLTEFKDSLPRELSGGMKQRVSIARALSYDAPILLMDEPFGALDALTRDHMNVELLKIWQKTNKTIVFVTHSISESVFLSDRVVVMSTRPGKINEIVDIDLERPRDVSVRETEEFQEYSKYLRRIIG